MKLTEEQYNAIKATFDELPKYVDAIRIDDKVGQRAGDYNYFDELNFELDCYRPVFAEFDLDRDWETHQT